MKEAESVSTLKAACQQGWLHGLPGEVVPAGIPIEVWDLKPPLPRMRQMHLVLAGPSDVTTALAKMVPAKTTLPRLSLVVRTDPKAEQDVEYRMVDAAILSIQPSPIVKGAMALGIGFNRYEAVAGINLNPGPPPGAGPVQSTGVNIGWIHASLASGDMEQVAVEVVDFVAPYFDGQLAVTLGSDSAEVERLLRRASPAPELILILPERASQRYVEVKLWDATVAAAAGPGARHVVFQSDVMECLYAVK